MRGWRYELFGAEAQRLKRGELALTVEGGEIGLVPLAPEARRRTEAAAR
jgi:hypothetical protein